MLSGFDKEIGISSSTSDGRVKVDAADVAGYLQDKLAQGSNIILTVNENNIVINAEVQTAIDKALESFAEGHEIQSDGTAVEPRPILNFAGASISVADDEETGSTVVTIDSANGHVIYVNGDDAVPQRSGLKFIGGRINTTDDPTGDKTIISIDGGYVIHFDGAAQTYRSILNFTGDAVTITDDENADSTIINIKKHVIQEEGGELPTRTHLNFVGSGIIATDDSENDRTNITLTNAGGSGHVIQDEGVVLTGRANLNFVGESVEVTDDATNDASVVTITTAGRLIVTRATDPTVTAVSGHHYVCDGVTTLNLPVGVERYSVGISDIGNTFRDNPITIVPNGSDYIGKPYQTSLTLDRDMSCVVLGFTNGVWSYLSAESFNDLGAMDGEGISPAVSDGDKGDVIVSGNGTVWNLDTSGVVAGSYAYATITVDDKGRITSASEGATALSTVATSGSYNDLSNLPALSTVATSGSYNDLLNLPTLGTAAALNVGTGADNVVQLDGTGKLPAVDGSLLTNLPTGDTAANITVDTTNFNNNLSGTDTTVQVALETLDDLIASAGGHTIQDEGTPLTQRTNLDFVGTAVTVTDDAGNDKTIVTVSSVDGQGWTGGSYDAGTGVVTFTSNDGLGFSTGDLRGATGATGATGSVSAATSLIFDHTTTPSDPGAGKTAIYAKSDGLIYKLAAGGSEENVGGASAFADLSDVDTTGLQTGQAMVWNGAVWVPGSSSSGREVLTANRTYYVRTDGSDSNDGLTDTAGGAFLTIQKALNVVGELDISIYDVTIQVGNGTFAGGSIVQPAGGGKIILTGDTTTPSNVVINSQILADGISSKVEVGGFLFASHNSFGDLSAKNGSVISMTSNSTFGSFDGGRHLYAETNGVIIIESNYSITKSSGTGAGAHIFTLLGGIIMVRSSGITVTLSGSPDFASSFVYAGRTGAVNIPSVYLAYSGAAIGKRYQVEMNGIINTSGGGTSYLPGSVAGTVATGGQYA